VVKTLISNSAANHQSTSDSGIFLETIRVFRDGYTIILQPIFSVFDREIASQLIQKIKLYLQADLLIAQGQKFEFLIDLQAIDNLNGDGLRLLSESCQFLTISAQCAIAFCGLNDSLSLIFEISRMDQKFQVLSSYPNSGFSTLAIASSD
jgi:anti-anti-sigma regulatory factor